MGAYVWTAAFVAYLLMWAGFCTGRISSIQMLKGTSTILFVSLVGLAVTAHFWQP